MKSKNLIFLLSASLLVCLWFLWNSRVQTSAIEQSPNEVEIPQPETINPYANADIKAVAIPSHNNTFGYDIYVFGAVLVHQLSRPGLPGMEGFATEEDAMKVAELVIKKIRNNELPPTVTVEELREMRVLQ